PQERRRRRHLAGRAAAHPARRQLDPVDRPPAERAWSRRRCRGPRLPPRRRDARAPRRAREGTMIPKRWVEAYLWFLLRNRLAVTIAVGIMTVFFAYEATFLKVIPQFLDFYPGPSTVRLFGHEWTWRKGHPYIAIYNDFRRMFGSANILTVIIE